MLNGRLDCKRIWKCLPNLGRPWVRMDGLSLRVSRAASESERGSVLFGHATDHGGRERYQPIVTDKIEKVKKIE